MAGDAAQDASAGREGAAAAAAWAAAPEGVSVERESVAVRLEDPAFGAYCFFGRGLPLGSAQDPRRDFVELLRDATDALGLDGVGAARYRAADEISLFEVARTEETKDALLNRFRQDEEVVRQALGFTFLDVLVAQVMAARLGSFPAAAIAEEHRRFLHEIVRPGRLAACQDAQYGGIFLLWAVAPAGQEPAETLATLGPLLSARVAPVARLEHGLLAGLETDGARGWLVLTARTPEAEQWANMLLFDHTASAPPPLLLLELARRKFDWQYRQYVEVKGKLDRLGRSIDRRLGWLIDAQRAYGRRLLVAGSRESVELVEKLSSATTTYADFRRAMTRIGELRTTLRINQENYRSMAARLTAGQSGDELFRPQAERMDRILVQLEYDSSYHAAVLERGDTILDAAAARLEVLRGQQERDEVTYQGIQTSTLTAIVVGLTMLQVIPALGGFESRPWFKVNLIAALTAGTFAMSQVVINWKRVNTRADRIATALAAGLLASMIVTWSWGSAPPLGAWALALATLLAGASVGLAMFVYLEERWRSRAERARENDLARDGDALDELLALASEELQELLEDLPPTEIYRVKRKESGTGKLARKGYRSVAEISDEIGVRYVVAPWDVARTVRRVQAVLRIREIEYKTGDYKAVHLVADLLGVGDDRDLDLTAEVQVKTPIQNWYAVFSHDRLYKGTGRPARWARLVAWALARLGDVELALFRRVMGWTSSGMGLAHGDEWRR